MRRLLVGAATDRGQVRRRNEDAHLSGESVFAVADGMGGHLAGDVASATALLPVEALDETVYADAASAQAALLDAILAANAAVVRKAADDPGLRGMGTTLTATIVEGRRLHVGHVGDSRAYLVRNGRMTRLTRDHTLVAHLIEEGQLTEEEAARHPQRSIVTRAIGVDVELEVDTMTIDLMDGDEILLCSDGLTGPVEEETILDVLVSEPNPQNAADRLVQIANDNGGPDNITVVLLRYEADDPDGSSSSRSAPTVIRPDADAEASGEHWTNRMSRFGSLTRDRPALGPEEQPRGPSRAQRIAIVVVVTLGLLAGVALAGWGLLSRSYYVGVHDGRVAIYQGIPVTIGPLELSWLAEPPTDVHLRELEPWFVRRLEEGVAATDLNDARRIIASARRVGDEPQPGDPSPDEPPDAIGGALA